MNRNLEIVSYIVQNLKKVSIFETNFKLFLGFVGNLRMVLIFETKWFGTAPFFFNVEAKKNVIHFVYMYIFNFIF